MTEEKVRADAKKLMAEVYADGFNIYQCLNKLKKKLRLRVDFPPEAIIWTCEAYLKDKPTIENHYPWFLRVFQANSERYFSQHHEKEAEKYKREPASQAIKDIMKGMFK